MIIHKATNLQIVFLLCMSFLFIENTQAQTYPPSAVVISPHSNSYFKVGSNVIINVYSTDIGKTKNNGTVAKVEFLVDGVKIGESTTPTNNTYTFTWQCVKAGEFIIKAKATNSAGVSFTSAGQYITVGTKEPVAVGMSQGKGKYLANIIPGSAGPKYNQYWNGVTAENACKWGSVEGSRDSYQWGGADVTYNHAKNNNMMFRYHAIVWGNQTPSWLNGLQTNQNEFKAELEEYITLIASRYKYADQVDVLNEQIGTHAPNTQWFRTGLGGAGATGYDWAVYLFERARALLPNTKLVVNDYGLEGNNANIDAQLALVAVLRDRGLIDGFGTQAHCFNVDTRPAAGLKTDLDRMAKGGIPIYVTELDIRGNGSYTPANQATTYKALFPVYWEHPSVAGVTIWGYVEGQTWMANTGIMSSTGTEKQALTDLKAYLQSKPNIGYPFATIPGTCCSISPPTAVKTEYSYNIGDVATPLVATGTLLKWYLPDGTVSATAPTPSTAAVGTFNYAVTQTGQCESSQTTITVTVSQPQTPFGTTPAAIPGTIQFEEFDKGGMNSAYFDANLGSETTVNYRPDTDVDFETCSDVGGGYNIGYAVKGEWLEYTVNVATAGEYILKVRAAVNGEGRTIAISSDGNALATVDLPSTGGWQVWKDFTKTGISLKAGTQVLRVTMGDVDYANLNYMTFEFQGPVGLTNAKIAQPISVALHSGFLSVQGASKDAKVAVYNLFGKLVSEFGPSGGVLPESYRGVLFVRVTEQSGVTSQFKVLKE